MTDRILILGADGFLGRAVANAVLDIGYLLRVLAPDPATVAALQVRGAEVILGAATDPAVLAAACADCSAAVTTLAVRRDHRPHTFLEMNVEAPRLLGEAALAAGVKKVVLVSEIGARPDGRLKYLASRWAGEQALQRTGVPWTILRFSHILGADAGYSGLTTDFERLAGMGPMFVLPNGGQQHFQPIVAQDAARCVVASLSRVDLYGQTLELGGPEVLTYEQLFDFFARARGLAKPKLRLPLSMLVPGAALLETFMGDPLITAEELRTLAVDSIAASIDVVSTNFGFQPLSPSQWAQTEWRLSRSA